MQTRFRKNSPHGFEAVGEDVLYHFLYSSMNRDWTCCVWIGPHHVYHTATLRNASDDPLKILRFL